VDGSCPLCGRSAMQEVILVAPDHAPPPIAVVGGGLPGQVVAAGGGVLWLEPPVWEEWFGLRLEDFVDNNNIFRWRDFVTACIAVVNANPVNNAVNPAN